MSTKKIIAYSAIGVVSLVLFVGWFPAGSFYFFFQREILHHGRQSGVGGVLWAKPAEAASKQKPAGTSDGAVAAASVVSGKPWRQILHGNLLLPLPPGKVRRVVGEGATLVIEFEEGVLTVDRFERGFLRGLFDKEYERINADRRDVAKLEDGEALEAAVFTTPADFHINMNARSRNKYAVSLLVKMLLWDCPSDELLVNAEGVRFRMEAFRLDGERNGALLAATGFGTRVLTVVPQGVFAFAVRGNCPEEWTATPGNWGWVEVASESAARAWRDAVRSQHPAEDPLRKWAEAGEAKAAAAAPPAGGQAAQAVQPGAPSPSIPVPVPTPAPPPGAPVPAVPSPGSFHPSAPGMPGPGLPRMPGR